MATHVVAIAISLFLDPYGISQSLIRVTLKVKVKMKSQEDDAEWIWDRNKFFNRKFLMQEMYQNYVEGDDWDLPQVCTNV